MFNEQAKSHIIEKSQRLKTNQKEAKVNKNFLKVRKDALGNLQQHSGHDRLDKRLSRGSNNASNLLIREILEGQDHKIHQK